ncbi:MAG: prolyl-tRNA synthetase associated domain-containing protein [Defluviitaleaceae bacterium]|nr:prolyl-tRNA synthetase associated domain-containing protein [Defluviitaleaceae bacterium]
MSISEVMTTAPADERVPLEKEVYKILDSLQIPYERVDNDTVSSMAECIEINKVLGAEIRKSIFLCNSKKTSFYLLIMPAEKPFDTGVFSNAVGCSRVSFAKEEYMLKHLGVTPGSATIMGLINDKDDFVQLIIDKEVADAEWFCCNPGANTSHLKIKTRLLLDKFLPHIYHRARVVEL